LDLQFKSFTVGQYFGIQEDGMVAIVGKDYTGGDNGPGKWAPTDFIRSRYAKKSLRMKESFKTKVVLFGVMVRENRRCHPGREKEFRRQPFPTPGKYRVSEVGKCNFRTV
jgi:hypothetical protein